MDVLLAIKPYIGEREIAGQNPHLSEWVKWYKGFDEKFHNYKVFTGSKKTITRVKKHLPTGKMGCEAWADLLINEKTTIKMGESDKEILDKVFARSHFWKKANKLVEKAFGLGIGAFVVKVEGLKVNEKGVIQVNDQNDRSVVKIETIHAQKLYPITIEDGEITECAFATSTTQNSYITCHLREQKSDGTYSYVIKTIYFKDRNFTTFEKMSEFDTKSDLKWFQCIYPNICDNDDIDGGAGISILHNHIDQMKAIDNKYDLYDNEFVHGRKKTYISTKLQDYDANGELIDVLEGCEEDVFYIPEGEDGHNLIQVDDSQLRSQQCTEALNGELSMFSYSLGLGKGFFTFNAESSGRPIQTATAVIMGNADLFRSVHKHEIVLEEALEGIVKAVIYASTTFTKEKFSKNAEDKIEVLFDDSIFEDKESDKNSARTDVQNGIMSEVEYRVKFYGESENDALKNLTKNPTYIAKQMNALLQPLTQKAITPKEFVKLVYGNENPELEQAITEGLQSQEVTADDLLNNPNKDIGA